jgi:cyanophycinase
MTALLAFSLFSACATVAAPERSSGRLVIVGGALSEGQDDIFEALLQSESERAELRVVIIPAASSKPSHYGESFRAALINRGVAADRVAVLPLALRDDATTASLDESLWRDNAADPELVGAIAAADVIWFTGGDQSRITEVLGTPSAPTAVLQAIARRLAAGATVGGTSAGAAIMSPQMIVGGSSEQALFLGSAQSDAVDQEAGGLLTAEGLGFFTLGWIDQHFDAKARLGRLILALGAEDEALRTGYGIDENTALVVDLETKRARVAGSGRVTRVVLPGAFSGGPPYAMEGIRIDSLGAGDRIDLGSGTVQAAADKEATVGREYYTIPRPAATGVFSSYSTLNQLLGMKLIDNRAAKGAVSYLIDPARDYGYRLDFRKTGASEGYWTYRRGQEDHYTVVGIELNLEPVVIRLEPLDAP